MIVAAPRLIGLAIGVSSIIPAAAARLDDTGTVDFVREIRPILSQHCFACHGPHAESRQAGLSFVTFDDATRVIPSGARAIVPGDRDASEVWRRINHADDPMPPRDAHSDLDPTQIALLGRWIDDGASYAPHWAYVPPKLTDAPAVERTGWPETDIDRHILARLETEGLGPAPDADDVTLLRRVTYDLTGLPPTIAEIDAFLADGSGDGYATVVDRLLATPRFGERLAMYWLDLVRYADTVGYHGDQPHNIWPYRDYVIRAFNENKPFDRFTIEQLAGDLLPDAGQEQLVASGYNRLLQTSHEGGVQLKEYRAIYQADRIRNVTGVWMGATVGCAQCHDHKYDPYTTEDFYALGAFFADVDDEEHLRNQYGGLNTLPTRRTPEMRVWSPEDRAREADVLRRVDDARLELEQAIGSLPQQRAAWEAELLDAVRSGQVHEFVWVDDELDTGGRVSGDWAFVRDDAITPHSGRVYRRQSHGGLVQHYTVDTTEKTIEIAEGDVLFAWVHLSAASPPSAVMLQFNTGGADWEHRAVWGGDDIIYGRRSPDWPGYRRMGGLPGTDRWVRLEVAAETVGLAPGAVVSGMAFTQFGGTVHWDDAGVVSGSVAPEPVVQALETPDVDRTETQLDLLAAYHEETASSVIELRSRLAALDAERAAIETSLPITMYTRALDEPREVRVLPRGNWLDETGPVVQPAVPRFFGHLDSDGRATRLDLARWLVTPVARGGVGEVTARVFVNRIWGMLYGEGLCPSPEDFGGQGQPPNHLALLDRLSIDFVRSGWDVKALVRRLVSTRTYRQASVADVATVERDPLNHLFARQSRHRMPAEMVRDTALAVSGLLVDRVGGPSVKPPQPDGLYRHLNFPKRRYQPDGDDGRWRRGVYMHWQRQYLHPMLAAFDAPTREECTARRTISNTPTAALTLMNDPVFVEAARSFAARLITEHDGDDRSRAALAMREATGRHPADDEIAVLITLLKESLQYYRSDPDEAAALLEVGAAPGSPTTDPVTHAAWTQVARAVLNLHETMTRE